MSDSNNCRPRGYVAVCGVDGVGAYGVTATGEIFFKAVNGPYEIVPWYKLDEVTKPLTAKQKSSLTLRASEVRHKRQVQYAPSMQTR